MTPLGPFWLILAGVCVFMLFFAVNNLESLGTLRFVLVASFAVVAMLSAFEIMGQLAGDKADPKEEWAERHRRMRRSNARRKREDRF